jgi:amidase
VTGLVGIKPTLGLTSRSGIVPLTLSFDVGDPLARTVTDAAIALGFMTGVDDDDPRTLESSGQYQTDYTTSLDVDALAGARIGIAREFMGHHPDVDARMEEAIATLEQLGATVVDITIPENLQSTWGVMGPAVTAEFKPQIEAYLSSLVNGMAKTLSDLITILTAPEVAESETPANPGRISGLIEAEESLGLADTGYLYTAQNQIPAVRTAILNMMADAEIEAILYPTMSCPATLCLRQMTRPIPAQRMIPIRLNT